MLCLDTPQAIAPRQGSMYVPRNQLQMLLQT